SYGPFHLGKLGRSGVSEVPAKMLREQLRDGIGKETSGSKKSKGWATAKKKPVWHRKPKKSPK
ncbi:MAG: pseudouridine synthase, partial [Alphaproteobacteria bacterium]